MVIIIACAWYGGPPQIGVDGSATLTHVGQKICLVDEEDKPEDLADLIFKTKFENQPHTTSEIKQISMIGMTDDKLILEGEKLQFLKEIESFLIKKIAKLIEEKKDQEP